MVKYDDGSKKLKKKILKKGQFFHFKPYGVHQEIALTDCIILEASSPHFNDRVRVEDLYGLKNGKGLPTTLVKHIRFK